MTALTDVTSGAIPRQYEPWWARAARPARPVPAWAPAVRAAVGMAVPLLAGLIGGHLVLGVYAGLGAMHATLNDRTEPARLRLRRIGGALGASALGMLVGAGLAHEQARWGTPLVWVVLTLVGFASGAVSATGPRGSAAGMLLLVSATLGSGMAPARPWWAAAAMLLVGAVPVLLLGLRYRVRPGQDPRQRALVTVYQALGDVLARLGTPQGATARQALTARLNQFQDLLTGDEPAELRRAYEAALAATEAASGLLWAWRAVPPDVVAVPGLLARRLAGGTDAAELPDWSPATPAQRALDEALRTAADAVAGRPADPARLVRTAPVPPPDPWRLRVRLLSRGSLRYGARVALCIAVSGVLCAGLPLERGYWVPMTVAFVLKPDLGSVFLRAVSRSVGTVLGVAVTAVLLSLTTQRWTLAVVAALCVALLPYTTAAHYGLNAAVITPMALVLVQLGGQSGVAEAWPRVLDTALASAVVLVFGYLLWPERAPHRIEPRLVVAADSLRAYLMSATSSRDQAQVWLRRTTYRALAEARQEVRQGLTEPPPAARRAAAWLPATAALERLTGAVAAYTAQLRYGGRTSDPAEVERVLAALDRLAAAARAHRPPTGRTSRPPGPHDPDRSALTQAAGELEQLLA
ncbi:FUSC family protein [Kitasatospora sp. NPDC058965]|uniref:FUSC family protein n=1 Tax=Kitasatospora sp. NPDC058965 TaxID=3346682 RepID=UPI0036746220